MPTITLKPEPEFAAIRVELHGWNAPAGATFPGILRTDANGSRLMRLPVGLDPAAGELISTDYEPALIGPVRYSVTWPGVGSASAMTELTGLVEQPVLSVAAYPRERAVLTLVTGYTADQESRGTIHKGATRAYPAATLGPMGARAGELRILCPSYEAGQAAARVYGSGNVVLLRQPTYPGMDMYHIGSKLSLALQEVDVTPRLWELSLTYNEVDVPKTATAGALGWDLAGVRGVGTFAQVIAAYPTFAELIRGPL